MGLEQLFCWVPWLIKWLMGWVPHIGRVHRFQRGVKVSGQKVKVISGWYFWLPHFSDIYVDNVVRKVVVLPEQLLTTHDGICVRVGGLLVYTIENIEVWLLENDDPDHGLLNEAARVLRDWVRRKTFEEIVKAGTSEMDELAMMCSDAVELEFGVDVRGLGLTNFARTRSMNLHHMGAVRTGDQNAQPLMIAVGE